MRTWDLAIALDGASEVPVFLQIARGVTDAIRAGRLGPGAVLPGTRAMANRLKVHRNTVIAAYGELRAEGWIDTRPGGGTFVRDDLPEVSGRAFAATRGVVPRRLGFDLGPEPPGYWDVPPRSSDLLALGGGEPDVRLIPVDALARAHRRAMRARRGAALAYADPRGHPKLLEALARMLSSLRGVAARPETMLVTRGSQQAIDLVTRALIRPGDTVAVEEFGYRPAWIAMQLAGARLLPIPVDRDGMVVEALAGATERIRAVYLTPHHQYPTMVTLSPARRLALLELARERRFAIVEDDYDHEFHYDGRPVLPLASADSAGVVVYVGTLSKILAPGLRLGFVVAPPPLADRLVQLRLYADRQGDQVMEAAVAELIDDGEIGRHVRRMRKVYGERRLALAEALRADLDVLTFELPTGGIGLWAHAEGVDVERWRRRAHEEGVAFRIGQQFRFDGAATPHVRLGYAAHTPDELREAVRRMKRALHATYEQGSFSRPGVP